MKYSNEEGILVKEASEITGLSRQVIRKWEDRYGIIQPSRHENGYRLYSKEDIRTLLKICELRDQGHSVRNAIQLLRSEEKEEPVSEKPLEESVYTLLDKGSRYDEAGLILVLKHALHKYGLERFLSMVIRPLLLEIGDRWERGEWDESQETVTSLVIRDFLAQIRRDYELAEGAPLILGCCLPGETHEIPLHITLLQAMMRGWQTVAAGASPKLSSIDYLVQRLQPKKLLLSATTSIPFEKNPYLFEELEAMAERNPAIEFYMGGQGAMDQKLFLPANKIRIVQSLAEVFERTE